MHASSNPKAFLLSKVALVEGEGIELMVIVMQNR